jgi:hypothetical protein
MQHAVFGDGCCGWPGRVLGSGRASARGAAASPAGVIHRAAHGFGAWCYRVGASATAPGRVGLSFARVPDSEPCWRGLAWCSAVGRPGAAARRGCVSTRVCAWGRRWRFGEAAAAVGCRNWGDWGASAVAALEAMELCPLCHSVSLLPWVSRFHDCGRGPGLAIVFAGLADPAREGVFVWHLGGDGTGP